MKLHEINHSIASPAEIWVNKHFSKAVREHQMYVQTGMVNTDDDFATVIRNEMLENNLIPVHFGRSGGTFTVMPNTGLRSMEGSPSEVDGDYSIYKNAHVTDFEGAPEIVHADFDIVDTGIVDLTGISEHVHEIHGWLNITAANIKRGGLGCLNIKHLKGFQFDVYDDAYETRPFEIIMKYIGKPDQVFECQQELIEAGFEAYAEL